jgi:hypothetical protein
MYSITEILIIQLLCFIMMFNSKSAINYLKRMFPFFNGNFEEKMREFINFYKFLCEKNPLILDYEYKEDKEDKEDEEDKEDDLPELKDIKQEVIKPEQKFEDKYLEKFKKFPNEFSFTEVELEQQKDEYEKIKIEYEKTRFDTIHRIQEQLSKINEIQEKGNIDHTKEQYTENINADGINMMLKFFEIEVEYDEDPDDFDLEELYQDLLKNKAELLKKMDETEKMVMTEDDMQKKAHDIIVNKKLDKYVDNYVLEHTPLGNIYMRYNNDKKSFEYFSNSTIPYRYLESVGRKYVMTYWCKPIFVDIEEELKRAEEKYEEEKKKKEEEEKRIEEERKNNPRKILAQLKNYNKETKDMTMRPMKNRSNKNTVLPPQIKANLPDVNKPAEKQLLKENANRYTWEGRLTNFCPLKKIDRKILDKKLAMTYADFKKMQQDQQNKK